MLIQVINEDPERHFLKALEEYQLRGLHRGVLVCEFSQVQVQTEPTSMLECLKNILRDAECEIYFLTDSDVIITWRGRVKEVAEAIMKQLYVEYFQPREIDVPKARQLFQLHDAKAAGEELRLFTLEKLRRTPDYKEEEGAEAGKGSSATRLKEAKFTPLQMEKLKRSLRERETRSDIEVLVVEDQDFSRKLLAGIFQNDYKCHVAENGTQAIELYARHAPNIAFLDIELPDMSGHQLAKLFQEHDPKRFIIMVTANHYASDVETAKANKVQGFIVKPYNRQKIFNAVDLYINRVQKKS